VPVPSVIGRYHIRERLGSGAFATVWLADDEALDSQVAVKVLAENWADHADVHSRFTQEAQIMRRADSDRLVRVFDVGELPDGRPYLVMQYASGGTLADKLKSGPLSRREAIRTAEEIARGVAVLHAAGVIHRDLKPSNILLDKDGRPLIADLGLAKAIAHASGFTVVAGSPGYMAPEQAVLGGGIDVRADVYAIGALLHHMLTGAPPTAKHHKVNHPVDSVVQKALRSRPADRYPSADALAAALASTVDKRRRRTGRAAAVLATASAAALIPAAASSGADAGLTRVADASGRVSVAVPAAWAQEFRDAGWAPAGVPQPAVVVGTDLAAWADPASRVPGLFAGLYPDANAAPALPDHQGCVQQPERRSRAAGLDARVFRWTRCAGTSVSFSEVLLTPPGAEFGVYVQIRQIDDVDRTDRLLGRLRIRIR
jgi:tRNA A-37 threonylcarbamoyl transferase component Bud32